MKAACIARYGGPGVLELRDLPVPVPGPGDLLVKVRAASVNPIDFKIRQGKARVILPYRLPLVLGNDLSGEVVEVGTGVTRFRPGDAVYARLDKTRIGAFAEFALVRDRDAADMPPSLDFVQSASLPLAGLTAWQALVEIAELQAGQQVLIHAGSGGVGSLAIQIAKARGAFVAATAGARNLDLVRSLGADRVIDYAKERFEDALRELDVVFDTIAGDVQHRSFAVLKRGGILIDVAGMPTPAFARRWGLNPLVTFALRWMTRRSAALARTRGVRYEYLFMEPSGTQLEALSALVAEGKLRPVLGRVFPFERIAEAIAEVEGGHATGKVVVRMDG